MGNEAGPAECPGLFLCFGERAMLAAFPFAGAVDKR
jgi:hypothetical protein